MNWVARLLGLCFTLITVILLAAVYLLNAPQGLQWGYRFASSMLPGELSIEHLDGRLAGPITLQGIHYRNDTLDLHIDRFEMTWQPGALIADQVHIKDMNIQGVRAAQSPAASKSASITLPDIHLPIRIRVDQATLQDIRITGGDHTETVLTKLALGGTDFHKDRLQMQHLGVTAPNFHVSASGKISPQGNYPMDITLLWNANAGQNGQWQGNTHLHGDIRQLVIQQRLNQPVNAKLNGTLKDILNHPTWQARISAQAFNLDHLNSQWPALTLSGALQAGGDLQSLQTRGELHSVYQGLNADHRFDINFKNNTLTLKRWVSNVTGNDAQIAVHGTVSNLPDNPRADLSGHWQGLRWPLHGDSAITSNGGQFILNGSMDSYQIHANAELSGKQLPDGTWSLDATGSPQQIDFTQITGQLLDGSLSAHATVGWEQQLHWDGTLETHNLNPAVRWPAWPGRIAAAIHSSGAMIDGQPQIQVALSRLHGEIKTVPFDGKGSAKLQGDHVDLTQLALNIDGNHLIAEGKVDEQWNMHWQIKAEHSAPSSIGEFQGNGDIRGPRHLPLVTASLQGRQIHVADKSVGSIALRLLLDSQDRKPSTLNLELNDATLGNLRLEKLHIQADGNAAHHRLQVSATLPRSTMSLSMNGRYQQQQWSGTLESLQIDAPYAGEWQLATPVRLAVNAQQGNSDELCLKQKQARACASASWNATKGWQGQGKLRALPLEVFKDWLPSDTPLTGSLDADASANNALGIITGKLDTQLKAGVVPPVMRGKTDATSPATLHQVQVKLILDQQGITSQLQADLAEGGNMQGEIKIERVALPTPLGGGQTSLDNALKGRIQGDLKDLSLLPALIPGVEHTQGRLFTTLNLSGSLDEPRITGEARLKDGSAAIPALGLNPDAIDLVARGDEQGHLLIDLHLNSKGGELHLNGDAHYDRAQGLTLQAQLTGNRAEVVNTPEYHILASPDLKLRVKGHRIDLSGNIVIPEANLRPRDVSGAVSPSSDVIIVKNEGPPAPISRWKIYSQVQLQVGDFVKFNGYGLRGLLTGNITLNDVPQRPTIARGELSIKDGQYRAYGQKLTVDRGRLLFFGGPVSNPGLDIRATRKIQEVTAGIMVRGTLRSPQAQVFSEPAMAEADALSYLLLGLPLGQASSSQGQQLYGAALSLGLAGSGLLANQIGQRFGIDEVTVESGGSFGSGALVLRHYLSPKLYISYGVGLMEHFNIFLMRYQITRRWALDAESGPQSGADLVYTLEKK